jgi:calcineurin-like phosphoesterase family protein
VIDPKIFFTADHHFGHWNLIKPPDFKRPGFETLEEMHTLMINRWNSVVGKHDTVYHLGDMFVHMTEKDALAIRHQLNGAINLVKGNHDDPKGNGVATLIPQAFGWIKERHRINVKKPYKISIVLDHYAGRVWSGSHRGSIQLHGHSHGKLYEDPMLLQFDVGVDCWNFYPISLKQVIEKIQKKIQIRSNLTSWPCASNHQHATAEEAWRCMMSLEFESPH